MKKTSGTMLNYYFVCKRKLWYHCHQIKMERENEDVQIGKIIDETTYAREKKQILINDTISIDFMDKYNIIHEVKKSKSIEEAGFWQVKYYIYYLKKHGVDNVKGIIDYPKLRQRKTVELTEQDEQALDEILKDIDSIVAQSKLPEVINKTICKKCAYYELCYI